MVEAFVEEGKLKDVGMVKKLDRVLVHRMQQYSSHNVSGDHLGSIWVMQSCALRWNIDCSIAITGSIIAATLQLTSSVIDDSFRVRWKLEVVFGSKDAGIRLSKVTVGVSVAATKFTGRFRDRFGVYFCFVEPSNCWKLLVNIDFYPFCASWAEDANFQKVRVFRDIARDYDMVSLSRGQGRRGLGALGTSPTIVPCDYDMVIVAGALSPQVYRKGLDPRDYARDNDNVIVAVAIVIVAVAMSPMT
ncbi:hypothetical protein L6452_38374 [Arctium lappa]|uniref:Uncharacterized protein n=1 Tax=Arctium lappa TaxID=4217 RepID=A0ACB8Y5J4_ARCLA|nr:hypothetical protein L6452_38374 [Arctium lappa]